MKPLNYDLVAQDILNPPTPPKPTSTPRDTIGEHFGGYTRNNSSFSNKSQIEMPKNGHDRFKMADNDV